MAEENQAKNSEKSSQDAWSTADKCLNLLSQESILQKHLKTSKSFARHALIRGPENLLLAFPDSPSPTDYGKSVFTF